MSASNRNRGRLASPTSGSAAPQPSQSALEPTRGGPDTGDPEVAEDVAASGEERREVHESLSSFVTGLDSLKGLAAKALEAIREEEKRMQEERRVLEVEREALREEKERMSQVFRDSEQVHLNIGGHFFTTTVATMRNAPSPSLFSAMFSGRHTLKPDRDGRIFIDRDGRLFHDILNWLRDSHFSYPKAEGPEAFKYLLDLRAEAEYYGLVGLVEQIDRQPWGLSRVRRCLEMRNEESWIYEDGPDELIFTVDHPCQLLGVGLCAPRQWYNVRLVVSTVDPDNFVETVSVLQTMTQTFTSADATACVCRLDLPRPEVLQPGSTYMISALIKGGESLCCDDCLPQVVERGVTFTFMYHESPNGTSDERGQFPELYVRVLEGGALHSA